MKQLFFFLSCIVCSAMLNAQSITPLQSQEYCPNTPTTFTATVPGGYQTALALSGAGLYGVSYAVNTVSGQTVSTVTFTGVFGDFNQTQTFRIISRNASGTDVQYDFPYKKVKSFFFTDNTPCTMIVPNLSTVVWPLCDPTPQTISFNGIQYTNISESPRLCFGSISDYEYLLPSGWQLNGNTSNGTTWIHGNNNISVTPDANTGDGVYIRIRPAKVCGNAATTNAHLEGAVRISRPKPVFSLSPAALALKCEYAVTQVFAVTADRSTVCPVTYEWTVGDHWTYNGTPGPIAAFIGPSSITLVSDAVSDFHGPVTVTPILNGVRQPTLTCNTSWDRPNFGIVGGQSTLCTGTSSVFSIYNAPINVTQYNWTHIASLPNYGATVITANTPAASSTTITKVQSGVIRLVASITDRCHQSYSAERANILVGGYATQTPLSGYTLAYPPCYTPLCTPQPVSNQIAVSNVSGTTIYTGKAYTNTNNAVNIYGTDFASATWTLATGSVWSWSGSGNSISFYPNGGPNDYVKFRVTASNSCGSLYYDISFYPVAYTARPASVYQVYPNPAKESLIVTSNETRSEAVMDKNKALPTTGIREITIIDKMGLVLRKQLFPQNTKQAKLNVAGLAKGYYLLKIFNGTEYQSVSFLKE